MIIHLATAVPFPFLPMAYVTVVFLLTIFVFVLAAAIGRLRDYNTRVGIPWLIAAILILAVNFLTAVSAFGGYYIQSVLLDVVAFLVFTSITIGILVQAIRTLKKRFEKYWAIPWAGFLIIGISVWLWNGVFRFFGGMMLDLVGGNYLPTSLIAVTLVYIGAAITVVGWVGCLIADAIIEAKNRRDDMKSRAAEAAS